MVNNLVAKNLSFFNGFGGSLYIRIYIYIHTAHSHRTNIQPTLFHQIGCLQKKTSETRLISPMWRDYEVIQEMIRILPDVTCWHATNHEGSGADSDQMKLDGDWWFVKTASFATVIAGIKMKSANWQVFCSKIPRVKLSSFGTAYLHRSMQTLAEYVNIQDRWYRPLFAFLLEQLLNPRIFDC